eukprot:m.66449 g.66449  ORF g.66449 m.66449 type:complete len:220 (-) comp15946_c0_seq9:493-1152(-)
MSLDVGKYAQIVCDVCQQMKARRRHIPHTKPTANKHNTFESWHVDVWGPHRVRSLFGQHRYVLTFIDAATRTAIPIFLPSVTAVSIANGIDQFAEVVAEHHVVIDDAIPDKVLQGIIPAVPDNIDVPIRGKCRLVFSGKSQVKGIDFDHKSSHHPRWSTIRMHLAVSPAPGTTMSLCLIDIKKAYVRTKNYTPHGHRVLIKLPIDATYKDDSGVAMRPG